MHLNHISGLYFLSCYLENLVSRGHKVICLFSQFILFHVTVPLHLERLYVPTRCFCSHTFSCASDKTSCALGSLMFAFPARCGAFLLWKSVEKVFLKKLISLDVNFAVGFGNLVWLLSL